MSRSIYEEMFGLKPLINASGTQTTYGGSLMPPVVIQAMNEAAKHFVDLRQLLERAGEELAKTIGVEAALITSGAGAGLTLAAAACMTGKDRGKMERLPETLGMRNEIIVQRGNIVGFTRLFRNAGAKLIEVGGGQVLLRGSHGTRIRVMGVRPEDIEGAITEKTCAIAHFVSHLSVNQGTVPLEEVIAIAHGHGLPAIVDAAAQAPPFERLHLYNDMGADLAAFSGGKSLCGPNDTGLILGRKDLIEACAMQASPNMGIGRPFKVSKEDIVGLVVAVKWFKEWWNEERVAERMAKADFVVGEFQGFPHVEAHLIYPDETGKPTPMAQLVLDEEALGLKATEVIRRLREGDPPIVVMGHYASVGIINVNALFLEDGQEAIICRRIKAILKKGAS